jgi:hypothetical protein
MLKRFSMLVGKMSHFERFENAFHDERGAEASA